MPRRTHRVIAPLSFAVAISAASLGIASLVLVTSPAGASGGGQAPSTFAAPSSIASVGPWIAVANRTSSTLTLLRASDGVVVRTVSHAALGLTDPTSIIAGIVSGRRVAFVGGGAGKVIELALSAKGTAVAVSRFREMQLKGCASRAATYLATDGRGHLVVACNNGALGVWSTASGALVHALASSASKLTHATALAVLGATAYVTNAAMVAAGSAPDGDGASGHGVPVVAANMDSVGTLSMARRRLSAKGSMSRAKAVTP